MMKFKFLHSNIYVLDLEKSIAFYEKALGLKVNTKYGVETDNFVIKYMGYDEQSYLLELTWLKDRTKPYDMGDETFHVAFEVDDYEKAHKLHEEMGCICYENKEMGIYFIKDYDDNWMEIIPKGRF